MKMSCITQWFRALGACLRPNSQWEFNLTCCNKNFTTLADTCKMVKAKRFSIIVEENQLIVLRNGSLGSLVVRVPLEKDGREVCVFDKPSE